MFTTIENQTIQNSNADLPKPQFPLLTEAAYMAAVQKAESTIRDRMQKPGMADYASEEVSELPESSRRGLVAVLLLVLVLAFVISAGKQVAAASLLFDNLPSQFARLSPAWASVVVFGSLFLNEFGSLLFWVAASLLPLRRAARVVLRAFACFFAIVAITANVSITLLSPVPSVGLLEWLFAVGVPVSVLGIGMIVEGMIIEAQKARLAQKLAYQNALKSYQAVVDDPAKHTSYTAILSDCLWQALSLRHKNALAAYTAQDSRYKRWIIQSEYESHQNVTTLTAERDNPMTLPAQAVTEKTPEAVTRLEETVTLLEAAPELRSMSTRQLERRYPGMSRQLWSRAKRA